MLYAFRNPFCAQSNPARPEDLRIALITADENRQLLSRFPGIINAQAGFAREDYGPLADAIEVVKEQIYTSPYHNPDTPHRYSPYQLGGIAFALARGGRALILDPMGLGKTLQGVGMLVAGGARDAEAVPRPGTGNLQEPYLPALVVCPLAAMPSWRDEFSRWTRGIKVIQLDDEAGLEGLQELRGDPAAVVLMSKEKFTKVFSEVRNVRRYARFFKTLIIDESHYFKNPDTEGAQAALAMARMVPHVLLLSGTPVLNAPGELYAQLSLVEKSSGLPDWQTGRTKPLEAQALIDWTGTPASNLRQAANQYYTFEDWSPEIKQSLNLYVRDRAVRRAREDFINAGGVLYTERKPEDQITMRKTRRVIPVQLTGDQLRNLAQRYRRSLANTTRAEALDFQNREAAFNNWKDRLRSAVARGQYTSLNVRGREDFARRLAGELRQLSLTGHKTVPTDVRQQAAQYILPQVVDYIEHKFMAGQERPLVVFSHHVEAVRDVLRDALLRAKSVSKVYWRNKNTQKFEGRVPGSKKTESLLIDDFVRRFKDPKKIAKEDRQAVILLTGAGAEGLNLAAADEVIFVERLVTPGKEYQAEDRVNRRGQTTPPTATYFIPLEPYSLAYANRMEQKRRDILESFGETATSDFSYAVDLGEAADALAEGPFLNAFPDGMAEMFLAEADPESFTRREIAKAASGARRNPEARENLPLSEFAAKPVDPEEEQISRIRTSLFYKFINEGYSNKKSIRVMGRIYGPGERLSPQDAKALAFQIAGRRRGSRFLHEGTNIPTPLSKHRAQSKRQDADAFENRKAYENMLAVGRKSGPYRVTVEPSYKTGKTVFYIWPMGREYKTEAGVKRAWERLK